MGNGRLIDDDCRYFVAYELAKKALTPANQPTSTLPLGAIIVAGGTAGVAMWSIAIPPDVRFLPLFPTSHRPFPSPPSLLFIPSSHSASISGN